MCTHCGERPVRYPSSGECRRCYQRRYKRERRQFVPAKRGGVRPIWRETGTKRCAPCGRVLPVARFGFQRNGRYTKPYSYCVDCRTWQNREQAIRARYQRRGFYEGDAELRRALDAAYARRWQQGAWA